MTLRGYRVRLRVVEEYDVALLAESADDAKAQAEADVRRGDEFEDIQDSWPEEIVSVEAVAAEPYPELVDGAASGRRVRLSVRHYACPRAGTARR